MSNLNDQQFAKYSALKIPDKVHEYEIVPLPASMERHGPGSYQPTLPGMENMLKGEMTHVEAVFNHPNHAEKFEIAGKEYTGDVPGSSWGHLTRNYNPVREERQTRSLRPSQDWLDDNYLHSEQTKRTGGYHFEGQPLVERIWGKNIIQDGHHRAARAILNGEKKIGVARFGGNKKEWTW